MFRQWKEMMLYIQDNLMAEILFWNQAYLKNRIIDRNDTEIQEMKT